jgi:hypothetical protein
LKTLQLECYLSRVASLLNVSGLILLTALLSCGQVQKVRQCRALIARVAEEQIKIQRWEKEKTPRAYRSAADAYDKLAAEVRGAAFATRAGKPISEEYAAALEALAPIVRAYAQALEGGDTAQQDEARRSLERQARVERMAATRVNSHCAR